MQNYHYMEEKNITLSYDMVPKSWTFCFLDECPKASQCIRRQTGRAVPDDIIVGSAVFPTVLKSRQCRFYKPARIIKAAWGFTTLFKDVKKKDDTPLRRKLYDFLGSQTSYIRYSHGEKLLTPEQQDWILSLFKKYGYTDNLTFDHYKSVYDFS